MANAVRSAAITRGDSEATSARNTIGEAVDEDMGRPGTVSSCEFPMYFDKHCWLKVLKSFMEACWEELMII